MKDSQRYADQARSFGAMSELAANEIEREHYLQLAGTYAQLAVEAAVFEGVHGYALSESIRPH